jgi:hypothetical protein
MGTTNPAKEGYDAFKMHFTYKWDNPYVEGTPDYDAWDRGYEEARNEMSNAKPDPIDWSNQPSIMGTSPEDDYQMPE